MKTRTLTAAITLFLLFSTTTYSGNNPNPEGPLLPSFLVDVSHSEYRQLMGKRYEAYNFVDTISRDTLCPLFVDPVISVYDFINAFRETILYNGIRVYPGLTQKTQIIPIVCLANDSTDDETGYRMLTSSDYTNPNTPFPPAGITTPETPLLRHQRYIDEVLIYAERQPRYGNDDNRFRKSRFYIWEDLIALFDQNIAGFNIADSTTYMNYSIRLETGFVPATLLESFHNRLNTGNRDYHYGFTVIFHILDSDGNSIVNPSNYRSSTEPYKNRYLEIGHPCPPLCGALHD